MQDREPVTSDRGDSITRRLMGNMFMLSWGLPGCLVLVSSGVSGCCDYLAIYAPLISLWYFVCVSVFLSCFFSFFLSFYSWSNLPVAVRYLQVAIIIFLCISSRYGPPPKILHRLTSVILRSASSLLSEILWFVYCLQSSMKCWTSSGTRQVEQFGLSLILKRARYWLRAICPMRSFVRVVSYFLDFFT